LEQTVEQVREQLARIHNFRPHDKRAVRIFVFNESMKLVDTMGSRCGCCSASSAL
jgi:hypothetical protein